MNWEHQIAVAFMHWWALAHKRWGVDERLLHAIPNAGGYKGGYQSNARLVVAMKAEGVRPGVSDYFLAVPRGIRHGLYIELKAGGNGVPRGKVSDDQIEFGRAVFYQGYDFKIAYGTDEAIAAVEAYLGPAEAPKRFPRPVTPP